MATNTKNTTIKQISSDIEGSSTVEQISVATQWQLISWKFKRHKLAVFSLIILAIFYFVVVFAEFMAPYNPRRIKNDFKEMPPTKIHFIDTEGRFGLRPFVYGIKSTLDMNSLRLSYTEDKERIYPLYFFVRGDSYKLWGLFESNIHLFGLKTNDMQVSLFGADDVGRDLLSRIIYGARISLSIGLIGIAISFLLGITLGGISGYLGGAIDLIIQRIIEFIKSIPSLPLWMALSAALPPHMSIIQRYFMIILILSFMGWTGLARVVRGKFLALREEDFVVAAALDGARNMRIIFKYLLPSFFSHIIATLTLNIPGMILGETALSFLGLGLQAPAISWGVLLQDAQSIQALAIKPWYIIPGAFVVIVVLAFNFVGDGLRDAADPYARV